MSGYDGYTNVWLPGLDPDGTEPDEVPQVAVVDGNCNVTINWQRFFGVFPIQGSVEVVKTGTILPIMVV
jgi:hypothetical protein